MKIKTEETKLLLLIFQPGVNPPLCKRSISTTVHAVKVSLAFTLTVVRTT